MATNGLGLPFAIELTGGEVSDYRGFDLIFGGERPMPKVLIADRIRADVEAAGGSAVIPGRHNKTKPVAIDRFAYRLRNRIERTFNRMKNARRMATPYNQTAASYLGFVQLTAIRIWIRHFVNDA
jgi:transposase